MVSRIDEIETQLQASRLEEEPFQNQLDALVSPGEILREIKKQGKRSARMTILIIYLTVVNVALVGWTLWITIKGG